MGFEDPAASAAWRHETARAGHEIAFWLRTGHGWIVEGCTCAVEEREPWWVQYEIVLDDAWHTERALVTGRSRTGAWVRTLEREGAGRWRVDGVRVPALDGIDDVDLESSALTNAFPVRRLALAVGASAPAPAAYVRALDLRVERLEQHYERLPDADGRMRFDYRAPAFDTHCVIEYDAAGLSVHYPGIASRIA